MARDSKPTGSIVRPKAGVEVLLSGEVALANVVGLVDEHFAGFGKLGDVKSLVINVSGMTRMTSFGVRQWLKGMDALPKSIELYLLGCPTFFVDQLNMVLNFGGTAQTLTVVAPYTCPSCGIESGEAIDVLANRAGLAKGGVPEKECARCGGKLEFDETPESYFSFVAKYAASSIQPAVAQLLAERGLYVAADTTTEKPPRIIKLVHSSVTYFRIIGTIGSMFRARPFLVGAEGEVVIDLAEVDRFDPLGQREWRRLLKSLAAQVPAVTLVDVTESFLTHAGDTLGVARNVAVWSALVPFDCLDCGRTWPRSQPLAGATWPLELGEQICTTCGGATRNRLAAELLVPLQKASTSTPPASAKLIAQRDEVLSRALTDASVAQAGEGATASLAADDTILGKYKIVRRLSAGGMAEVFLAKQVGIGGFEKPVALKRIQRQLLETRHLAIEMFLNEAKIAGRLMHPNIVQVLDVGEVGGALYLAMEYVHGKDLRQIVKKLRTTRATMPVGEACYVVREVAQALHHAYWSTDMAGNRLAVVHRDVSPHNIILSFDGTVKLLDFGVAMSAVTEQNEQMIVGKWQYMSPEHTMNQQIDHRSDLFSLGVVMYLLLTGRMPFAGTDARDIVKKIRAGQFESLQQAAPDVPEPLAALVHRLLAPNPDHRPQTGHEVVTALTDIARGCGMERSASDLERYLGGMYSDERGEMDGVVDLARISRPSGEMPPISASARDDRRSGAIHASPGSSSLSPTSSASMTVPAIPSASDAATARAREVHEDSAKRLAPSPTRRPPTRSPSHTPPVRVAPLGTASEKAATLRTIIVIAVTVVVAIAAYFLVRPT